MSPATSASRPEKTISQSLNSSGLHSFTIISRAFKGSDEVCFHLTASLYFLPAERLDAPIATRSKFGCIERSWINRWPTLPVHPSTPSEPYQSVTSSCGCCFTYRKSSLVWFRSSSQTWNFELKVRTRHN